MKKFTKILLGSILSVAMVVTGGLAFLNNNDAYAKSSLWYDGYGVITTSSDGATVEHGTYKQLNASTEFTGLRLTGKTGATFNLGSVDISSSNWLGDANTTVANTDTEKNESFLEVVFDPHDNDDVVHKSSSWGTGELDYVDFKLTQGASTVWLRVGYLSYDTGSAEYYGKTTITTSESDLGCYRRNETTLLGNVRKGRILGTDAKNLGLGFSYDAITGTRGNSQKAYPFYYDFDDVAIYTAGTSALATTLQDSYLIRDFDSNDDPLNKKASKTIWNGFEKADGSCVVNVTATFGKVTGDSASSVIITKLGDTVFDNSNPAVDLADNDSPVDVIKGITTNNGSVKYGTYAQSVSGKEYTGVNLIGGVGTTFNLGTMSINDTYFDDNFGYVKGVGAVDLSTKTDNGDGTYSYKLYKDVMGSTKFNGANEAETGKPEVARSFLSFVINPSKVAENVANEKSLFTVTLREVGKPENFVTYNIKFAKFDATIEMHITCTATNNSHDKAERFYKSTGITINDSVRRIVNYNGSQSYPVSLYYDFSQQAAYTNVGGGFSSDGLYGAFRIRDFDDYSATSENYSHPTADKLAGKTVDTWKGFSQDAEVEISLEMTNLHNSSEQNSIILTDLAGYNYGIEGISTLSETKIIGETEMDLGSLVCYDTKSVSYVAPESVLNSLIYKVNDNVVDRVANVNGGDVISIYSANGALIGNVNVISETLTATVNAVNGKYEVWRGDELQTISESNPIALGDVIRLIPNNREHSELPLSDLRVFELNDVVYNYDTSAKSNAKGIPAVWNNDGYYTVEVNNNIIYNCSISIQATFDRYCKITVIDDYIGSKDFYAWTMTDTFSLDSTSGGIFGFNSVQTGKSNGEKSLVAYARLDLGEKYEGKNEFARTDGFTYDVSGKGQLYYSGTKFNDYTSSNINKDVQNQKAYCIVPNMVFETIYIGFNVRTEIKLEDDGNDGVNDQYSGLRFVVEVNKKDWNRYKFYSIETYENNRSATAFYNYITTKSTLDKVGVTDYAAIGTKWMSPKWDPTLGTVNGLGLTCISKNGEKYDGKTVEGAKGGFIFYGLSETTIENGDMWLDNSKLGYSDDYYTYALTIRNFKDTSQTYVLSVLCSATYLLGGNTGLIEIPLEANLKTVCQKKYDNVVNAGVDKYDDINRFKVSIDNVEKYYSLSYEHIKWLNEKGGLGHNIAESSTNTVA